MEMIVGWITTKIVTDDNTTQQKCRNVAYGVMCDECEYKYIGQTTLHIAPYLNITFFQDVFSILLALK